MHVWGACLLVVLGSCASFGNEPAGGQVLLPVNLPAATSLRAAPKKVFAHYFTQFPISIDNKEGPSDYYARGYLAPEGEGGKHAAYGGFLRDRPLPQPVRSETDWAAQNFREEVRRAAAVGIDGFTVDLLSYEGRHWLAAQKLMDAARDQDPGFKIVLMPDMTAGFKAHPEKPADAVRELAAHPSAFHLPDGRLVVAPFNAQEQSATWWKGWLAQMKAAQVQIAFVPVFQGWHGYAKDFAPISHGFSDWGWRSPKAQASWRKTAGLAHSSVKIWMAPVAPQDMRPKSLTYTEAGNSENFRVMWENAILGGADWVQLITWNDYSEHTHVAPSVGTQTAFYELCAYYTLWFKSGRPPPVARDAIYYFHRRQFTTAQPDSAKQPKTFARAAGSDPALNEIEMLALLTAPGTLEIESAGKTQHLEAKAGMTSFRVPLAEGQPVFRLRRAGRVAITLTSAFPVSNHADYQDLLYYAGSSLQPHNP